MGLKAAPLGGWGGVGHGARLNPLIAVDGSHE